MGGRCRTVPLKTRFWLTHHLLGLGLAFNLPVFLKNGDGGDDDGGGGGLHHRLL